MNKKYLLDIIDNVSYYTESFALYNLFYPKSYSYYKKGNTPDWNIITFKGEIIAKKINNKYVRTKKEK
jgi:hypothetical protein